ncbi:hypothetical protein TPA0909_05140 [Streptomyces albus]|nr:hypothetical protein TPA0909_05140 [Streptomyces albus]
MPAEEDRADDQQRQRREDDQRELEVEEQQGAHDAEEGEQRDDGGHQAGLEERGEGVHVGRHPGHHGARLVPLVVVESQTLQLREDLHPQGVQHAFTGASGQQQRTDLRAPLGDHHGERHTGGEPDGAQCALFHTVVDAVPDQHGQQQSEPGVECGEDERDDQGRAETVQQTAQPVALLGLLRALLVDVGHIVGGRQRGHLGEEFGAAGQSGQFGGEGAGAPRLGGGHPGGARAAPLPLRVVLLAPPQPGGDALDRVVRVVDGHARRVAFDLAQFVRVGQQLPVEGAAPGQLLVGADVGQPSAVEDGDTVGQREGGLAVGDQQGGAARHHTAQRVVDLVLDAGVHGGGRVVQEQQPRVAEQGAGQGYALALAAGEGQSLFADGGVVAVGQLLDETVRLGGLGGGADLFVGGVGRPVGDVLADGRGEEEGVLGDQSDGAAQRVECQLADVLAADAHGAAGHVVVARQQHRDGGLAAAAGSHQGHGLTRFDPQAEAVQHGVCPGCSRR